MGKKIAYHPELKGFVNVYVCTYEIYTLKNPLTSEIFYVGKTKKGLIGRLAGHLNERGLSNKPKREYIKGIISSGGKPIIELVEFINGVCKADAAYAQEREYYWIRHYKALGCNLLNVFGMDEMDCVEYRRYKNLVNQGVLDLEYYFCGHTLDGCEVYDEKRMDSDGFTLEKLAGCQFMQFKNWEDQHEQFLNELRQEVKSGEWPPSWISLDLLKYILPMPEWSPEFAAEIPPDEFLLDLELDDCDFERDDWEEDDEAAEIRDFIY